MLCSGYVVSFVCNYLLKYGLSVFCSDKFQCCAEASLSLLLILLTAQSTLRSQILSQRYLWPVSDSQCNLSPSWKEFYFPRVSDDLSANLLVNKSHEWTQMRKQLLKEDDACCILWTHFSWVLLILNFEMTLHFSSTSRLNSNNCQGRYCCF